MIASALLYGLGLATGIIFTIGYYEAREADRLEALKGRGRPRR